MYTLALQRRFDATHHLIGGDWGVENQPHSHPYRLELQLRGAQLDKHGYLVDLVDVESHLNALLARYAQSDLNTLPEFTGLNPSLEHFARILCIALGEKLQNSGVSSLVVQLWENEDAWASFWLDL